MRALRDFLGNKFSLIGISPLVIDVIIDNEEDDTDEPIMETREYDLNGMYFKDLPKEVQNVIRSYSLSFIYFDGISDEDIQKMFRKLNNGKALSTKARNIANCGDLVTVSDIANHPFFEATLTERGKLDRKGIPMVVKMAEMLTKPVDEVSFKSSDFNESMATVDISAETKATINNILDMALRVHGLFEEQDKMARRKFVSENNFISLVPFMKEALDEGISDMMFKDFVKANFSGRASVSEAYASAARSASASTSSIVTRQRELEKAWDEFFAVDGEDNKPVEAIQKPVEATEEHDAEESILEAEKAVESVLEASEHRYGMRLRGFAPMCQPMEGLLRREDDVDDEYYDILVYSRELSQEELDEYELDKID